MESDDLLAAARASAEVLTPAIVLDWSLRAGDLEWSCLTTLAHVAQALMFYAGHLATRSPTVLPFRGPRVRPVEDLDPPALVGSAIGGMSTLAGVLTEVVRAAPPHARAFHPEGLADPDGFLAMGCDEVLVHTSDICSGLGLSFAPDEPLALRVVRRLFPWAPADQPAWSTLLWCNGRTALPGSPRLTDWGWQCAPLAEWDGRPRAQ